MEDIYMIATKSWNQALQEYATQTTAQTDVAIVAQICTNLIDNVVQVTQDGIVNDVLVFRACENTLTQGVQAFMTRDQQQWSQYVLEHLHYSIERLEYAYPRDDVQGHNAEVLEQCKHDNERASRAVECTLMRDTNVATNIFFVLFMKRLRGRI